MKKPGLSFNLRDQLAFYGSYHQHPGNQIVHFIFVPLIMWSVGVWMAYTGPVSSSIDLPGFLQHFLPVPPWLAEGFEINLAFLVSLAYTVYYIILEPFAGCSWAVVLGLPLLWSLNMFQRHVPYAWAFAIGTDILGWFMQIKVGHNMIERRRPALMDSFFQSMVLAGLFAWMEALFCLGYRPQLRMDLQSRIHESAQTSVAGKTPLLSEALKPATSKT